MLEQIQNQTANSKEPNKRKKAENDKCQSVLKLLKSKQIMQKKNGREGNNESDRKVHKKMIEKS